jgi:hypothetical protein
MMRTPPASLDLPLTLAGCALLAVSTGPHLIWCAPLGIGVLTLVFARKGMDGTRLSHLAPAAAILTCLVLAPDLSDDFQRYLWEGHALNQGYSPYLHSPQSLYPELDHPAENKVNHDEMTAIYPPLAQYLFQLSDHLGQSVYAWKAIILLTLLPLWFVRAWDARALLLASPVLWVEGLWNVHLDVVALAPAVWMIYALERNRGWQAGIALGLLVAIKWVPLVFAPFCFLHLRGRERFFFLAPPVILPTVLMLPFIDHLPAMFASFRAFASDWYFNNPLFHALSAMMAPDEARLVMGAMLGLTLIALLLPKGTIRWKLTAVWTAVILFSPTVHPWYLIWLLPLAAKDRRAWVHLAYFAASLSYLVLVRYRAEGVWEEALWWMIPEWVLLLLSFIFLLSKKKYSKPDNPLPIPV